MVICAETAFTAYSAFIIPVFHQKNKVYFMNTQSLRRNASADLFAAQSSNPAGCSLPCSRRGAPAGLFASFGGVPTASIVEITAFANAPGRQ